MIRFRCVSVLKTATRMRCGGLPACRYRWRFVGLSHEARLTLPSATPDAYEVGREYLVSITPACADAA